VIPAVYQASDKAVTAVLKAAARHEAFSGVHPKSLNMTEGRVHRQDQPPASGVSFQEILQSQNLVGLDGKAKTGPTEEMKKYSIHSFGPHFCEVA